MRVGTRCEKYGCEPRRQDHPHACGDKRSGIHHEHLLAGSSPCVWGQVQFCCLLCTAVGIIPMRVGTSFIRSKTARFVQDHPHACGDKCAVEDTTKKR